jgi:hypothetical protein
MTATASAPLPPVRLLLDEARCYPTTPCPDAMTCARYLHRAARLGMNYMPYRVDGEPCAWYIPAVLDAA